MLPSSTLIGIVVAVLGATPTKPPVSGDVRVGSPPDTNTLFEPAHYDSLDTWKKRREWLRMEVRVAAGLWPEPEKSALNAHVFGKINGDGYTIEKAYFESYPGFYVTGNLYRSKPGSGSEAAARGDTQDLVLNTEHTHPGVLCPHGHWKNGRLEQTEVGNIPARCIMLARMGCTVFAYDMVGYNDSKRQIDHRINTPALDLWGITSLHLQTWNGVRAIDFLQSLSEVDPDRIGVTGASGGGTQTYNIAAVDDRVSVTCPVNMISHRMQGGCVCENAPCLRIDTNNMEIGALFAPKPMLMVSATGDWTKDTPKVEYPFIKSIYALYGKQDDVENVHVDAQHNYNQQSREAMYHFFAKHLLGWSEEKANAIKEHDIPAYKAEDLLVWNDDNVPKDMIKIDQLAARLRERADRQIRAFAPGSPELAYLAKTGIQHMIAMPLPLSETEEARFCREDEKDVWRPCMRKLLMRPDGTSSFFTTFNRTGSAEAVREMFLNMVAMRRDDFVNGFRASGALGPAMLAACPFFGRSSGLKAVVDMNRFNCDSDEAYLKELNIPHIRRIGGLRAIAAVACNGPIWFHNVGDHFDEEFVKASGRANGVEVRVTKEKASDDEIDDWLKEK